MHKTKVKQHSGSQNPNSASRESHILKTKSVSKWFH
nr:MAG TPA: hypothetical protein [Caudoviricetes sp.]